MPAELRAFEVNVKGENWQAFIQAPTAGKAKYQYLLRVRDAWEDVSFKHLECHRIKSMPPTRQELAQRECDAFNVQYPVGTMVRYWSGEKEGEPTGVGPIYHPATVVSEHAAAWIKGAGSCHSITHVESVPEKSTASTDVNGAVPAGPPLQPSPDAGAEAARGSQGRKL